MPTMPFPHEAAASFPALAAVMACREAETHNTDGEFWNCTNCGEYGQGPTNWWKCECGEWVFRFRGDSDVSCGCGQEFNSSGQRLVSNWRRNPSLYDDEIGDMEGYEMMMAGDY